MNCLKVKRFSFQATFYMLLDHQPPPPPIPPTSIQSCNNNDESFTPAIANSVHKVAPVFSNNIPGSLVFRFSVSKDHVSAD